MAVSSLSILLAACSDSDGQNTPADAGLQLFEAGDASANIVDTAVAAGSFNTLVAALQATGLDATLANTSDTFTVFAPTDKAFAKLGDETINALLADPETLTSISSNWNR